MTKTWASSDWGITIRIGSGQLPVFQQIVNQISFHTASGHLKPGDKLPPVRTLASALDINFNTVAKSYQVLAMQGLVVGRNGGGSSIAEKPVIVEQEKDEKLKSLYQNLIAEAASYGLSAEEIKKYIQKKG